MADMVKCEGCFEEYDNEVAFGVCPHCGYYEGKVSVDPRFLPVGTSLHDGRYIIGTVLGNGGFGITYRAWDSTLQNPVAIKEYWQSGVVNRSPGDAEVFIAAPDRAEEFYYGRERLLHEAQIVSKFQSPAIARVNDFFTENGTTYMVMELLRYQTLEKWMSSRRSVFTPEQVESIGIQACEALKEIHAADVIHRDIAPDNIFINDEGKIKIIDFGSARLAKDDEVERLILMKEGYSPIEQYEAIDLKHDTQKGWTDLYALGATMYYCITGTRPMESKVRAKNIENHQPDMKEPMELNPNVSEHLNNVIMKAMAINAHERFQTADEMLNALRGEIKVLPLKIYRRRKRAIRAGAIGGGLAAAAIVIVSMSIHSRVEYDKITLDPADITVWYCQDSGDSEDAKGQALQTALEEKISSTQFDEINVEFMAIPQSEYNDKLEEAAKAGTMPTLFEVIDTSADYLADCTDVSDMIENLDSDTRNCSYLEDYQKQFAALHYLPTGFDVPVVYVNTSLTDAYSDVEEVSSMADVLDAVAEDGIVYVPVSVDQTFYFPVFSDYEDTLSEYGVEPTDGETFVNGESVVCFAMLSDYETVRNRLGTALQVIPISGSSVQTRFTDSWAISGGTDAENNAAEVLLSYMYTDNAQIQYYVNNSQNGNLPLNKTAMNQYIQVHWQLENVLDNSDHYRFEDFME